MCNIYSNEMDQYFLDIDDLNEFFVQLSLDPLNDHQTTSGHCTEECTECKNKSQSFDFTSSDIIITENDFNIDLKYEDGENNNFKRTFPHLLSSNTTSDYVITENDFNTDIKFEDGENNDYKRTFSDILSSNDEKSPPAIVQEEKTYVKREDDEHTDFAVALSKQTSSNFEKAPLDVIRKEINNCKIKSELSTDYSSFIKEEVIDDEVKSEPSTDYSSFIKEEIIDDEVKSEPLTDYSSSDDEDNVCLIERGGKEKTKRSHKKKCYQPRPRPSRKEFECSQLYHCSGGHIIENNNSNSFLLSTFLPSSSATDCIQVSELDFQTSSNLSQYIPNIWSPESGYDIFQSSSHSFLAKTSSPSNSATNCSNIAKLDCQTNSNYCPNICSPGSGLDISQTSSLSFLAKPHSPSSSATNCSNIAKLDCQTSSDFFPNICSPESGYDTSQSSSHSPSPPIDHEKEKRIREIINSFHEVEKEVSQRSNLQQNSTIRNLVITDIQTDIERNEPVESVNGVGFEDACSSSASLDSDFINIIQNEDTDEDSLLNDLINIELYNSLFNPNISETPVFGSVISESVINQSDVLCCRPTKPDESCKRKISPNLKDSARKALRNSTDFSNEKYKIEEGEMLRNIQSQMRRKETIKIIDIDEREKCKNLQQTNLHSAVIESNIEKVYCIIEALKRFGLDLFDINNKDTNKKTALDYAVKQNMSLLINYLKENNAVQSVEC